LVLLPVSLLLSEGAVVLLPEDPELSEAAGAVLAGFLVFLCFFVFFFFVVAWGVDSLALLAAGAAAAGVSLVPEVSAGLLPPAAEPALLLVAPEVPDAPDVSLAPDEGTAVEPAPGCCWALEPGRVVEGLLPSAAGSVPVAALCARAMEDTDAINTSDNDRSVVFNVMSHSLGG
jgi:hypothetical protein